MRHRIKSGAPWPREWHWYTRLGIQPPFPWLGVAICSVPILLIAFAVTVGVLWPW